MLLFQFFDKELISTEKITITIHNIFMIVTVIILSTILLFIIKKAIGRKWFNKNLDSGLRKAIYQIIKYFVIIFSLGIILENIGLKISLLFAGSAALLVGFGIGIQQVFNDFVSGFILLFERTITVGDIIEVNSMIAKVKRIGLRTSELETRDKIVILVPNSKLVSENVINWSHNRSITRFNVSTRVAINTDLELAKQLLYQSAIMHTDVSKEIEPLVKFTDFGESAILLDVLFWSDNMFEMDRIKSEIRFNINKLFKENNITIPFLQHDIYIKKT